VSRPKAAPLFEISCGKILARLGPAGAVYALGREIPHDALPDEAHRNRGVAAPRRPRARRDVLRVHPRGDVSRPRQGVFSTRAPDRPNPIGLHRVTITAVEGRRLQVRSLEALDGTPILDVKRILSEDVGLR
jgi:hypothetical protein